MNPELPSNPRAELEARLTAYLLGELPAHEAAALRQALDDDAELAKLCERLKPAIKLVQESAKSAQPAAAAAPLKLSEDRRQKVLAHFKTIAPKEFAEPPRRKKTPWLIPVAASVALMALLATLLLPALSKSKSKSMAFESWIPERQFRSSKEMAAIQNSPPEVASKKTLYRNPSAAPPPPSVVAAPQPMSATAGKTVIVLPAADPTATPPLVLADENGKKVFMLLGPSTPPTGISDIISNGGNAANQLGIHDDGKIGGIGGSLAANNPPGYIPNQANAGGVVTANGLADTSGQWNLGLANSRTDEFKTGNAPVGLVQGLVPNQNLALGDLPLAAVTTESGRATLPGDATFGYDPETHHVVAMSDNFTANSICNSVAGKYGFGGAAKADGFNMNLAPAPAAPLLAQSEETRSRRLVEQKAVAEDTRQGQLETPGSFASTFTSGSPNAGELNRLYKAKEQELAQLQTARAKQSFGTFSEDVESRMPKTTMVPMIEHADAAQVPSRTLGEKISELFTGKVERRATIKIKEDVTNVPRAASAPTGTTVYDPGFEQTALEVIQSEPVLDDVIKKLDLKKVWAKKEGNAKDLTETEARALLKRNLDLRPRANSSLVDIGFKSEKPEEAAQVANAVAEAYHDFRQEQHTKSTLLAAADTDKQIEAEDIKISQMKKELAGLQKQIDADKADAPLPKVPTSIPTPQPEVLTRENAFSTFSLNVADVSFKLAAASLEKGVMPDPASVRSEEFINAFDYRDPDPAPGAPLGFAWERAHYPFAHNRDLLRFSVKTAAAGRPPGRALNIVLLLDNSGSMERADRVQIIHEALRVLAAQLQPQDKLSIVTFARTPRLWIDGISGSEAGAVVEKVSGLTPQGGTNLEDAMKLAYETARRHYLADGINRVVLLTDGAANLGNVNPAALKQKVEENRRQGVALDCFGIGWEGYNDDLLETLSRNGDGRYGFLNTPAEAATDFAGELAGALNVAAADVKVQVEFNPKRVTAYRQIGYAKHQLTKAQFRDNTVDAAEIGAAESGNALYTVEINAAGEGAVATVHVRYKVPGTTDYREHAWEVPYTGNAIALDQASPAMRLAATAGAFSEWLAASPYAAEVTSDQLLGYLSGVPKIYGADARPAKLEWMIRQAKSISGK